MAYAASIDQSGSNVLDVPIKDPTSEMGFKGGSYPWDIEGDNRAVLHIKNVDVPGDGQKRQAMAKLYFDGGEYNLPLQEMDAGQTVEVDIKKLRDDQVKDVLGNVIPLTVTGGQLDWNVRANKGQFIGRLIEYNPVTGVAASFSCVGDCPCNSTFRNGSINPGVIQGFFADTFGLASTETDIDCNGQNTFTFDVGPSEGLQYFSSNESVVTVSGNTATLVGAGSASITANWDALNVTTHCFFTAEGDCNEARCDTSPVPNPIVDSTVSVKPTITGPTTLWWFHGETPTGYATQITLTTSCSGTSWQWNVTSGSSKVTLGTNGSCSITVTSAASSGTEGDVAITATVAGITSDAHHLTVRAPYDLLPDTLNHQVDPDFAYITHINYTIRDQFTTQLPSGVPVNEQWTTGIVSDYSGMNWTRGNPTGFTPSIAYFADIIQGEISSRTPTPSAPTSPLGTTKVYHWGQDWYIGSTSPGSGRRVQSNTLQKYTDHATHENIVSPNP